MSECVTFFKFYFSNSDTLHFLNAYFLQTLKKSPKMAKLDSVIFWGGPQGPNFLSPRATMLALRLDCSTAALITPQKVLSIRRLVELKMLDFSDCLRNGISILTSAADHGFWHFLIFFFKKGKSWILTLPNFFLKGQKLNNWIF